MYHFFVKTSDIIDKHLEISGSDYNHMRNVVRLSVGDDVIVSDDEGNDYNCAIESYEVDKAILRVVYRYEENRELPVRITLFQGLPKSDKMELIIQKAVELGVCEIVPVAMKNCVVKLDGKAEKKVARWQAIATSAANQSKRSIIPTISRVMDFSEAVDYSKDHDYVLVPYESAEGMDYTREIFEKIAKTDRDLKIAIFIGPEGGFDDREINLVKDNGGIIITLGKRILRTETAGMFVLSVLSYMLER